MGEFSKALAVRPLMPSASTGGRPPDGSDFWFEDQVQGSKAGIIVSDDSSLEVGAFYAAVRIIAETVASLPCNTFRRVGDGGKERATDDPLFEVLRYQPNRFQTAFEFFEMTTGHALMRGNSYILKVPGPRGPFDQLIPMHPKRVQVLLSDDRPFYKYTPSSPKGVSSVDGFRPPVIYNADEVMHLRGFSSDGFLGLSVIQAMRDTLGLSKATEWYGSRFFAGDSHPRGALQTDKTLSDDAHRRLVKNWAQTYGGVNNAHKMVVLEQGMEWKAIGISNDDSQFLETRKFQVSEIARWFRIPPHKLGDLEKATFSNIEQQSLEFLEDTLRPWLVRWEQAIRRDLIVDKQGTLVEFNVDAVLRADIETRFKSYRTAVNIGVMSPNEVRARENLNPREGGDDYVDVQTIGVGGGRSSGGDDNEPSASFERAALVVHMAAERTVTRETAAIEKWSVRLAGDPEGWANWVRAFYRDHAAVLMTHLAFSEPQATAYCNAHRDQLIAGGVGLVASWKDSAPRQLAAVTLREDDE